MAVFLEEPGGFFLVLSFFDCCWYACGCRSPHTHTHTHPCDNISFWNLRIVKACASVISVICDSPVKVGAKGQPSACEIYPRLMSNLILYNMRRPHEGECHEPPPQCNLLQIQGAQLPKSRPCHLQLLRLPRFFLLPYFRGVICQCNAHAAAAATHAAHMQHELFYL